MSVILHIETSTEVCSVALSQSGAVIYHREDLKGPSHNTSLGVYVKEAISMAESHAMPLDAVAVSCGPGSYTGLRIGVSMAKGVCYARKVPLLAVETLKLLTVPALLDRVDQVAEDALLVPMLDARRMEVYAAVYDRALRTVLPTHAMVITPQAYREYLDRGPVLFLGRGAAKARGVITHPNALFMDDIVPLASDMVPLAERAMALGEFQDVAYFEPFYLKEFVATTPRKLL